MKTKKIAVIGGGPAGMMAAIRAADLHQDVTLFEKNPALGRKLLLSGKGRCNLTNACDLELFLERFSGKGQFLRDAFKKFFNQDLMDFFEQRGLKLEVERQLRVFPHSDRSAGVLNVLEKALAGSKVRVVYNNAVNGIIIKGGSVTGVLCADGESFPADRAILATGGVSYRFTGSAGEGLAIAERLGHSVTSLRPGLVPLRTAQRYPADLEGLALKNIRLRFESGREEILSDIGELLFTDTGVSGPLVLSLSGKVADWLDEKRQVSLEIDLKPALTGEQLDERLLREFKLSAKKSLKNALKSLLPLRMVNIFLGMAKIAPGRKASQVTQQERRRLVSLLKGLRLDISGTEPIEEAMVTRGGVSLKEIDPRTMGSRLVKGLYFAGEMIDVDADTGGFNLQAAFSTGYLAGESAAL